jgi:hypothetical protein
MVRTILYRFYLWCLVRIIHYAEYQLTDTPVRYYAKQKTVLVTSIIQGLNSNSNIV